MEKEKFCDLVFILDASGSMQPLTADTVGGFNEMLNKQKEAGLARVTTVAFANRAIVLHDGVSIMNIEPLTEKEYSPCGGTALLDAIGNTLLSVEKRQGEDGEDRPAKTIVVITTDGEENASREWRYEPIKRLIEAKQANGWEFIFLGANIDVIKEGARLGVAEHRAYSFYASPEGVRDSFGKMSAMLEDLRK